MTKYGFAIKPQMCREFYKRLFSDDPQFSLITTGEVIAENYTWRRGPSRNFVQSISEKIPLSIHCLSISLGSTSPLNLDTLREIKEFSREINAKCISDHVCFSSVGEIEFHSLLPLPFSEECLQHLIQRIIFVQEYLELPFAIENPSYYISLPGSEMSEAQFLRELVAATGCNLLLDVNNVVVNSFNCIENKTYANALKESQKFLRELPLNKIIEVHIAGHEKRVRGGKNFLLDTHGSEVHPIVLELLKDLKNLTAIDAIILERDQNVPPMQDLVVELNNIKNHLEASPLQAQVVSL